MQLILEKLKWSSRKKQHNNQEVIIIEDARGDKCIGILGIREIEDKFNIN